MNNKTGLMSIVTINKLSKRDQVFQKDQQEKSGKKRQLKKFSEGKKNLKINSLLERKESQPWRPMETWVKKKM